MVSMHDVNKALISWVTSNILSTPWFSSIMPRALFEIQLIPAIRRKLGKKAMIPCTCFHFLLTTSMLCFLSTTNLPGGYRLTNDDWHKMSRGFPAVHPKSSCVLALKKDKKTQNYCPKCEIFLCIGQCFENYHTQTSY